MYKARARSGVLTGAAVPIDAIGLAHLIDNRSPVAMAAESHPFPSRTRPLSPPAPMVLGGRPPGRVGRRRIALGGAPSPRWGRSFAFRTGMRGLAAGDTRTL